MLIFSKKNKGDRMFNFKNLKGAEYWLHTKEVKLRGGKNQRIFYFSKDQTGSIDKPEGYTVVENKRTGLPFLKKA